LQDDFFDGIEQHVAQTGLLPAFSLSYTFSYLRANDLIYRPAIKSCMMGEVPSAFDLLYWKSDATGFPGKVAAQHLRYLCQQDQFVTTAITLFCGVLHLPYVTVPVFAIGCETDHIAAWPDSYRGVQQMRSQSKTFVVAKFCLTSGLIYPSSKIDTGITQILICVCPLLICRAVLHFN
tara:strand:+ start:2718 stop:3251 length:534 start_codon:yes stop_codon:yes gene_type:complete